eukprot:1790766-Amphidinium_carterae.4
MNELDWERIIQRIWPQELNFFHVDAPTRRRHCLAHYRASAVMEKEYRFIAIQAGLQDEKSAFAAAQELGAWTMDLLWTEVVNRIARVEAYTRKDDPTFKAKTKENVKGYSVVPQSQFVKLYEGDGDGKNEERLANYFETGVTFALFQKDLWKVRRMLSALIARLPRHQDQKEAFWQWYPARPNYNTMEDRSRKEVFGAHLNDYEIPFTAGDLPEKFFEEPKRARTAERAIPTVPDFVANDRPTSNKMIHPDYKDTCFMSPPEAIERIIEDDWIDRCWYSQEHQHGMYMTWEHRKKAQLNVEGRWRDRNAATEYYHKLKASQRRYKKIDLSTSLRFFRRMTPQNDTFKQYRCDATVEVFRGMTDAQIAESIVFEARIEGQQHVTAGAGITPRGTNRGIQRDDIIQWRLSKEDNPKQQDQRTGFLRQTSASH